MVPCPSNDSKWRTRRNSNGDTIDHPAAHRSDRQTTGAGAEPATTEFDQFEHASTRCFDVDRGRVARSGIGRGVEHESKRKDHAHERQEQFRS